MQVASFSNPTAVNKVSEELNRLGTTIVVATHNTGLVRQLGHPTLNLDAGRLTVNPGEAA